MKLTIELDCENAAFSRQWSQEAQYILKQFWEITRDMRRKDAINHGEWKLRDHNGSTVGIAKIEE